MNFSHKSAITSRSLMTIDPVDKYREVARRYRYLKYKRAAGQSPEWARCTEDIEYFIRHYCQIYDPVSSDWILFDLWSAQVEVLHLIEAHQQTLFPKARQVGLTWLALAYILHGLIFKPIFEALVFSRTETESIYLLSDVRLRGMLERLPPWLRPEITVDAARHFRLANGSGVRAFPSNSGDSYSATFALVDEADLVPDLNRLLRSVKPTIDAGGKITLVSRIDKRKPQSQFKQMFIAASAGENEWRGMFLPWHVHPDRTPEWYEREKRDIERNTGSLDDLHEQYPATVTEAFAARTLDKRIAPAWLERCYDEQQSLPLPHDAPAIPGLRLFSPPEAGYEYVIGADPAEGNPTSDDSALNVLNKHTGEQVAVLWGKFQPSVLGGHIDAIGNYYNHAAVMVERNNHGHAVLLWLRDYSRLRRLPGLDEREGWLSTSKGKTLLYDAMADAAKDSETIIHDAKSYYQLASIEGATLRAPEGLMDDCADAYALSVVAAEYDTVVMTVYDDNIQAEFDRLRR